MTDKISGAEYPLSKVFSSEFEYEIPSFQRPYAWTEDETGELFDDLFEFYVNELREEQYFLGSIVLAKEDKIPKSSVIDGQQRLTTLTILFAILASKLEGEDKREFCGYIIEVGNKFESIKSKPRLRIRDKDNDFFRTYIQGLKFKDLYLLNPAY